MCFSPDMQTLRHTPPRAWTLGRVMPGMLRYCVLRTIRIPESRDTTALNRYPYVKRSLLEFGSIINNVQRARRKSMQPLLLRTTPASDYRKDSLFYFAVVYHSFQLPRFTKHRRTTTPHRALCGVGRTYFRRLPPPSPGPLPRGDYLISGREVSDLNTLIIESTATTYFLSSANNRPQCTHRLTMAGNTTSSSEAPFTPTHLMSHFSGRYVTATTHWTLGAFIFSHLAATNKRPILQRTQGAISRLVRPLGYRPE